MSALEKIILGSIGALALCSLFGSESDHHADLEYEEFDEMEDSIMGLHAFRFTPVYKELPSYDSPGVTNIGFTQNKSGTYIIKEDGEIVYVGQSQNNLYRTILRHFQQWNDAQSPDRITYKNSLHRHRYTVRIIFASPTRALKLEEALIRKYRPRDNAGKLFMIEPTPRQEAAQEAILEEYEAAEYDYPPDWD